MNVLALLLVILSIAGIVWLLMLNKNSNSLSVVPEVDLSKYSGNWYEIARLPTIWETGCQNATANYSVDANGNLKVINRCQINGKNVQVEGIATPAFPAVRPGVYPGSFNIKFADTPANVKQNYNVLYLDPNYQYALDGTPDRKNLWIISRTPTLSKEVIAKLVAYGKSLGYPVDKLHFDNK
jgi:apolipoprotein D and lipocalin family protein